MHRVVGSSPWPARDDELKTLWDWRGPDGERHSVADIGVLMKLSKDQVGKRAQRLDLDRRDSPIKRNAVPRPVLVRAGASTLPPLRSLME